MRGAAWSDWLAGVVIARVRIAACSLRVRCVLYERVTQAFHPVADDEDPPWQSALQQRLRSGAIALA
jgi:hypothetical protein